MISRARSSAIAFSAAAAVQVGGQLAVTAGPDARVAGQPPVVSREEVAQLGDVTRREPEPAAIVHAVPVPVRTPCLCSRVPAGKPLAGRVSCPACGTGTAGAGTAGSR